MVVWDAAGRADGVATAGHKVPPEWHGYIERNAAYFRTPPVVKQGRF